MIVVLLEYRWMPGVCVVDFEKALNKSVLYQFTKTRILGCFFHFKQALWKKMKKFKINEREAYDCTKAIDLLAIFPLRDVPLGIKYLQAKKN